MQRRCCSWAWFGDENHWSCSDDGEPAGTVRPLRLTACNAQRAAAVGRRRGPPHSQAQALQKNVLGSYRRRADQFSARSSGSSSTSLPCAWQVSVQPASLHLVRCTRYASYDVGFALYVAWRAACCRVRFGGPATPLRGMWRLPSRGRGSDRTSAARADTLVRRHQARRRQPPECHRSPSAIDHPKTTVPAPA